MTPEKELPPKGAVFAVEPATNGGWIVREKRKNGGPIWSFFRSDQHEAAVTEKRRLTWEALR